MIRFSATGISLTLILLIAAFSIINPVNAQTDTAHIFSLQICCNKTTSVVFPQIIKNIDRGSMDVEVHKVNGTENILQLKATKENFNETNLTVITADGKLYSFILQYASAPLQLTVEPDSAGLVYEKIAAHKRFIRHVRDEKFDVVLRVNGVYIRHDIIYYQIELDNLSVISYDTDLLQFFIKDKRQGKRTARQTLEQIPLYVYGNIINVPGQSKQIIVAAFPKFTIPDKKLFHIRVTEKNGGRHLELQISNRTILKARPL